MLISVGHKETVRIKRRFKGPSFTTSFFFTSSSVNKHDYLFASIMQRLYSSVISFLDIGVI